MISRRAWHNIFWSTVAGLEIEAIEDHTVSEIVSFGPFQLDLRTSELRKNGIIVRLQDQPCRILAMLLEHPGELVTRDEIQSHLWSDDTSVDFEYGINNVVTRRRAALGDTARDPQYIETLSKRGYRFVAAVIKQASPPLPGATPSHKGADSASDSLRAKTASSRYRILDSDHNGLHSSSISDPNQGVEPVAATATPRLVRRFMHRRRAATATGVALAIVALVSFALFRPWTSRPAIALATIEVVRVTASGDIREADISPDGKYVVYVRETSGREALWLKQLASGSELELATVGELQCPGLAFSPDGNYVYFVRKESLKPTGDLYQVSFLGGNPTRVLTDISGAPAISPDGRKVAFVRSTLATHGEDRIVTANLDGSGERVLASYRAPGIHFDRITWTSDGRTLVFPLQSSLVAIPAEGGAAKPIPGEKWNSIDDLRQLPPGGDLIVVGEFSNSAHPQIFSVSLAGGAVEPISHDLANYTAVRATADGKMLLAVQQLTFSTIQLVYPGSENEIRSLSAEDQSSDGVAGLATTPDGKIVYSSAANPPTALMEIDENVSGPHRIVKHGASDFSGPAVSPRGDFLVVTQWHDNDEADIWRMDRHGEEQKRLTAGKQDTHPSITPDGQWMVYSTIQNDKSVLMKMPTRGGPAIRLTDYEADTPSVSPDGASIASYVVHQSPMPSLAIIPITGGQPTRVFQLPETASPLTLEWTPDGRGVAFINDVNGVSNIWQQLVAGGTPKPVTHFQNGKIFGFQWFHDGRLALSRGSQTVDAVLLRNHQGNRH